jgi:hypothetical protein
MSRSLRGLSAGLQTGLQLGGALRGVRQQRALADESARFNVTEGAYGSELDQNVEQVQGLMRQAQQQAAAQGGTMEDMARIEAEYMPSIQELQRRSQMTAPDFSIASGPQAFGTREEATRAARPMRAEGLARVYEGFGDVDQAEALRERADASRLRGMQMESTEMGLQTQRRELERTQAFDTGMADINRQTFEDPMQRTQAILDLVEQTQGPQARMQLQASYTGDQLNQISLDSAKFQQGFQQAFTKGIDATMKWLDSQSPGFTLERRGNQVIRVDEDGSRSVFASGSDFEIMEQFAGMATPSNFLTLAQNKVNRDIARERMNQERSRFIEAEDAQGNLQVIDVNRLPRDEDGQPVMPAGMRRKGARETKDLNPQQQRAYDALKGTDAFKRAVERGDQPALRALLVRNNIPPEVYFGEAAEPPGGGSMTPAQPEPALTRTDEPVAEATDEPIAAPAMGLTREQTQARADQEMSEIQRQTRTRRTAIQTFERMPQVVQATQAARDLRRAGRAAEANNIEALINERRQEYVESQLR